MQPVSLPLTFHLLLSLLFSLSYSSAKNCSYFKHFTSGEEAEVFEVKTQKGGCLLCATKTARYNTSKSQAQLWHDRNITETVSGKGRGKKMYSISATRIQVQLSYTPYYVNRRTTCEEIQCNRYTQWRRHLHTPILRNSFPIAHFFNIIWKCFKLRYMHTIRHIR